MEFTKQFQSAARVSTPLVAIRTFDPWSAINTIKRSFGKAADTIPMVLWDTIHGCQAINDKGIEGLSELLTSRDPESGKPLLHEPEETKILGNTLILAENNLGEAPGGKVCKLKDIILFISMAHLHISEPSTVQAIYNLRNMFKQNGHMIVLLISPGSDLPKELQHDFMLMDEPLPNRAEIIEIAKEVYKAFDQKVESAEVLKHASDAVVGLPAFGIEQSFSICLDPITGKIDVDELWHKKKSIINQTRGLQIFDAKDTLDSIGGLHEVKEFYTNLMQGEDPPTVILFMDELGKMFSGSETDRSGTKGELAGETQTWMEDRKIRGGIFMGIPGVAKSTLAKAIAGSFGIPLIHMNIAAMQSGLVGSTGENFRAATKIIDAIGGGNILAIGTSNELDGLPLGLRRRFEFAPTYFFDKPTAEEKKQIWEIKLKSRKLDSKQDLPNDTGWTGAEIHSCVEKAYHLRKSVKEAAKWVVPVTVSEGPRIAQMCMAASGKYLSAGEPGTYQFNIEEIRPTISAVDTGNTRRIK